MAQIYCSFERFPSFLGCPRCLWRVQMALSSYLWTVKTNPVPHAWHKKIQELIGQVLVSINQMSRLEIKEPHAIFWETGLSKILIWKLSLLSQDLFQLIVSWLYPFKNLNAIDSSGFNLSLVRHNSFQMIPCCSLRSLTSQLTENHLVEKENI